jgi:hypothetical protein
MSEQHPDISGAPARHLRILGGRPSRDLATAEIVSRQPSTARTRLPVAIWPGQDFTPLMKGYDPWTPDPVAKFATQTEQALKLYTMEDAFFVIDNGADGLILDRDGWTADEPGCFRHPNVCTIGRDLVEGRPGIVEMDDVFVGNDAAWHNYFHFLCYGVARCYLANSLVPPECQLVMPDYASRKTYSNLAYSQATYDQAFEMSGLADRVTRLPVGLYHARKLRFFWTDPVEPTRLLDIPEFYRMFADIRRTLHADSTAPRRLLVSRDAAADPRIGAEARDLVRTLCVERGFTTLRFEDMDLRAQAQALFNADCIVAPHGAGLANILFGQNHLKVLELNTELDGNGSMRACFYQLAAARGQDYMVLNGSRGEITRENMQAALDLCCAPRL